MIVIDSSTLEAELSKAQSELQHLQQREHQQQLASSQHQQKPQNADLHHGTSRATTEASDATATLLYKRAKHAQDQINFLQIHRDVVYLLNELVNKNRETNDGADAAAGNSSSTTKLVTKATETCTSLGLLLLRHPHNDGNRGEENNKNHKNFAGKSIDLYKSLYEWYDTLRNSTLQIALSSFSRHLRKHAPEFPSNERSSKIISDILSDPFSEWRAIAKCLLELQIIKDALDLQYHVHTQIICHSQRSPEGNEFVLNAQLPCSWRWNMLDELCKPLAERVRFHFLEEQTGLVTVANSGSQERGVMGGSAVHKPSNMDRFPEWLFRFLREVVDNHEVHSSVMLQGVQPLVDSVMDSLLMRASLVGDGLFDLEDEEDDGAGNSQFNHQLLEATNILHHLRQKYYSQSSTYFLREVARMARHALRAKSFFHHPDVVGMGCTDRSIVLRGIEQLFLFDSFLVEKVKKSDNGEADVTILPPKLTDTFLSTNEDLMQWWMAEERDGSIDALDKCASSTLSSYKSKKVVHASESSPTDMGSGVDSIKSQPLFPPVAEVFTALLHSARSKAISFSNPRSQKLYIANVITPLVTEFLDVIHAEAALLRKQLLARPSSSSASSNILRSPNLLSDNDLKATVLKWMSVITGTHVAAQALRRSQAAQRPADKTPSFHQNSPSPTDVLDQLAQSVERLRDAMLEDFVTSAFVETIILERAKFASYMMRCPFVLSQEDSIERRGQREKDDGHGNGRNNWALSPDLNDSFHVVSLALDMIKLNMRKLDDMFGSDGNEGGTTGNNNSESNREQKITSVLSFGSRSVFEALSSAIAEKFMEVALDEGMTPEVRRSGAQQFHHDVVTFAHLFDAHGSALLHDSMYRVEAATRLMAAEPTQIVTLRETLHSLVTPNNTGIRSLFERNSNDADTEEAISWLNLEDFYADEKLMEEALSMLNAKGFGMLGLDEAISIINRVR